MANSLENIGQAPLFASCPQPERDLLATLRVPMTVASGNDVMHQGDFGATIGVILEGRASVWRDGSHVADLQVGDCFGELALLAPPSDGGHRTASIRADSDCRVDTISERDLNTELSQLPNIAQALRDLATEHRP
jgi:CRP-like cAMP-binding protein